MSKSEQRKHQYKTTKSLHESHEASKHARYIKNKQDRHFLIQRKRSLIEETHVDESISMSNLQVNFSFFFISNIYPLIYDIYYFYPRVLILI